MSQELPHTPPRPVNRFCAPHGRALRLTVEAGDLLLGGALEEPTEQAFLLFQGDSPEAARRFAEVDPYVLHGVVVRWRVRKWNTVVGEAAATPIRPAPRA